MCLCGVFVVSASVFRCVQVYKSVCACVFNRVCACVIVCLFMCVCAYFYVFVCVCVCASVHVCISFHGDGIVGWERRGGLEFGGDGRRGVAVENAALLILYFPVIDHSEMFI